MYGSHYLPELDGGGSMNIYCSTDNRNGTAWESPTQNLESPYDLNETIKTPNSINFRCALYHGVNHPHMVMGGFHPGDSDESVPVWNKNEIESEFTAEEINSTRHHLFYNGRLAVNRGRAKANLHVTGNGADSHFFLDSHSQNTDVGIRFYEGEATTDDANLKWHLYHEADTGGGSFNIKPDGSNKNAVYIPFSTGNVGIGNFTPTDQPTEALHVAGNILCGQQYMVSDRRLKKNIGKLDKGLKELLKLNPISFQQKTQEDFNSEESMLGLKSYLSKNDRDRVGLVAQEIEEIVPEVVHEDSNGIKSIDYTSLIPVLIKAVQEQNREIVELRNLVNSSLL
jgi:hypothetical protein